MKRDIIDGLEIFINKMTADQKVQLTHELI
jgi:hypothetical protein